MCRSLPHHTGKQNFVRASPTCTAVPAARPSLITAASCFFCRARPGRTSQTRSNARGRSAACRWCCAVHAASLLVKVEPMFASRRVLYRPDQGPRPYYRGRGRTEGLEALQASRRWCAEPEDRLCPAGRPEGGRVRAHQWPDKAGISDDEPPSGSRGGSHILTLTPAEPRSSAPGSLRLFMCPFGGSQNTGSLGYGNRGTSPLPDYVFSTSVRGGGQAARASASPDVSWRLLD